MPDKWGFTEGVLRKEMDSYRERHGRLDGDSDGYGTDHPLFLKSPLRRENISNLNKRPDMSTSLVHDPTPPEAQIELKRGDDGGDCGDGPPPGE